MGKRGSRAKWFTACVGATAFGLGLSASASAQGFSPGLLLPAAAVFVTQADCFHPTPSTSIGDQIASSPGLSKSAAILGEPSALERMRQAQASLGAATSIEYYVPRRSITPNPKGARSSTQCGSRSKAGASRFVRRLERSTSRGDIFASRKIAINRTVFDADWKRVRAAGLSRSQAVAFVGKRPASNLELIQKVNLVTNRRIRYVDDRVQFGRSDYWAGAQATLASGRADCEDFALTKMHLLMAYGFNPKDLTLTIAKDMIHGADHAVLLVRHEGRYLMLDNMTDRILDGSQSNEYRPIFSYSDRQAWLHGYALDIS